MLRIIAGEYRGRKLETPKDISVRPTTDRVKESLFNILQNRIAGRRILDLFAGTGGFVYGNLTGFILSYIGVILGSISAFSLARVLGYDFVKRLVSAKKIAWVQRILNSTEGTLGIFVICFIPWIPKDILVYTAGITPIKPARFLTIFCLARIPGIIISVAIGNALSKGLTPENYTTYIELGLAILVLVLGGFLLNKRIAKK